MKGLSLASLELLTNGNELQAERQTVAVTIMILQNNFLMQKTKDSSETILNAIKKRQKFGHIFCKNT